MSIVSSLKKDGFVQRYGLEDMFRFYYTCVPNDSKNQNDYECLKGKFDTCYSDTRYDETKWLELSVPKIIPKDYHSVYLHFLQKDKTIRVLGE